MKKILLLNVILCSIIIASCGGTKLPDSTNPEEIFNAGLKFLEDEDYLEAKQMFELIILQYPASQFADDAQYYQGEVSYRREEFIMAAFNYNRLRRQYPGSPFSKDALFKSALSYYRISPPYDRDQENTRKAIEAFQEFQYLYPDDKLKQDASDKIQEMRNKLAYREYFTGLLYRKLDSPRSSVIYFDAVINNYQDTDYYEPAFFSKIEVLIFMKKSKEAESIIIAYKSNFPKSDKIPELDKMLSNIK